MRLSLLRIRFCGGCNPEIDRGEIVERVLAILEGRVASTFDMQAAADCTLHVCGCAHACLDEQSKAEDPGPVVSIQGLRVNRNPVAPEELAVRAAEAILDFYR